MEMKRRESPVGDAEEAEEERVAVVREQSF